MNKEKIKTSDATIGIKLKVKKQDKNRYNKVYFNKELFDVGEVVYIISEQEHQELTQHTNNVNVKNLENKLEKKDAEILSLNKKIDELKQTLTQNNAENKSINAYKQELESKYKIINELTTSNKEKDATIKNMKERIDELGSSLENSVAESEHATLQQNLDTTQKELDQWQHDYATLSDEHLGMLEDYEKLKNDNNAINKTNQLLNDNILGLTASFESTKEQLILDVQNKEKELKETIEKQQSHIDEITSKYESLLAIQDNIPQKTHYTTLQELKDENNQLQLAHEQKISELQLEHAHEISELEITFANEKSDLKNEYANEKAQMLVAYNNQLNNLKHEKNNIVKQYNNLLGEVGTLTKWNTLFGNNHKHILENKTPIELEDIPSEQLPSTDKTIEYVPKK